MISHQDSKNSPKIYNNFVIIAQPRCGSGLLTSLLHSHPLIRSVIEPINPSGHSHFLRGGNSKTILPDALVHDNIEKAMDLLFAKEPTKLLPNKKVAAVTGFKIMVHQIHALRSEESFWRRLFSSALPITIFRRNILRQFISEEIVQVAGATNYWGRTPPKVKIELRFGKFMNRHREIIAERNYASQRLHGRHQLNFWYEDIKDNLLEVTKILPFLGCSSHHLTTNLRQQNDYSLKDLLLNYKKVVKLLLKHEMSHYLGS